MHHVNDKAGRARSDFLINIRLPWPPTINTYYTIARGRKILSKKGREFKKAAAAELLIQQPPKGLTGRLEVNIDVFPPDRRRRDIDNLCKATVDSLQDYGVFFDDEQIDILRIRRKQIEKPGYVRVYISEIE